MDVLWRYTKGEWPYKANFADATFCFMVSIWLFMIKTLLIAKNDFLELKSFHIFLLSIDPIRESANIAWPVASVKKDHMWLVLNNIYRRTWNML